MPNIIINLSCTAANISYNGNINLLKAINISRRGGELGNILSLHISKNEALHAVSPLNLRALYRHHGGALNTDI